MKKFAHGWNVTIHELHITHETPHFVYFADGTRSKKKERTGRPRYWDTFEDAKAALVQWHQTYAEQKQAEAQHALAELNVAKSLQQAPDIPMNKGTAARLGKTSLFREPS